jgi:hypothetical protein
MLINNGNNVAYSAREANAVTPPANAGRPMGQGQTVRAPGAEPASANVLQEGRHVANSKPFLPRRVPLAVAPKPLCCTCQAPASTAHGGFAVSQDKLRFSPAR